MILSRRSFLKVAGLSAVAVAGASMFTGCNVNNLFSTGVVYSAKEGSGIDKALIQKLNENKFANAVPGRSDLYSNAPDKCKKAVQNQLNGAQLLSDIPGAKDVEVESANIGFALDKDGKETSTYVINAVLVKKKSNS
jgi:hypothetical protein